MSAFLKFLQEKVVFLPKTLPKDFTFSFDYPFEEYFWKTPNNGEINVLHFKVKKPKNVLIYLHGNADNLERWGEIASEFTTFGDDVLVMDYRGYGKSTGTWKEEFLYEDVEFLYDFAKKKYGEERIILYGRSLGGAFAIHVAMNKKPKKIILESAFFNLKDVVEHWVPEKITTKVAPKMSYHFLSNEKIVKLKSPLYHFHGDKDQVVSLSSGRKLFEVFKDQNTSIEKKFIEIKGANHDNIATFSEYQKEIKRILD